MTSAKVTTSPKGLRIITLRNSSVPEALVEIYEFGAHVTKWCDASGNSKIYCSPTAVLDGSKAIRGGIPICFPQFGKLGPLKKQHGFARNKMWKLDRDWVDEGLAKVRFVLEDDEETRKSEFGYKFRVEYCVTLENDGSVNIDLVVKNKDSKMFSCTSALHAYFSAEVRKVQIEGLKGLRYKDNLKDMEEGTDPRDVVVFDGEVDRIYLNTPNELKTPEASLLIVKKGLPDAVVWNPFITKTKGLSDMPNADWERFFCIEPAAAGERVAIEPGGEWQASLTLISTS